MEVDFHTPTSTLACKGSLPECPRIWHALRFFGLVDRSIISLHRSTVLNPLVGLRPEGYYYYTNYMKRYSTISMNSNFDSYAWNLLRNFLDDGQGLGIAHAIINGCPAGLRIPEVYIENLSKYFMAPGGLDLPDHYYEQFRDQVNLALDRCLGKGQLRPLPLKEAYSQVLTKLGSKSSGFPYNKKKRKAILFDHNWINQRLGYLRNDNYPIGDCCG